MELEQLTPMRKELSELREDVHARTRREAELREEIQTLSEAGNSGVSAGATARTVVITCERTLPKFSGRPATDSDPEVGEWTREIRQHVVELPESQKIDTIVGNLTGDARDEVQLLEEGETGTAEKILQFLWRTYRPIETLAELTLKMATRKQRPDETVQSYSLALMKLHQRIKKRDKGTLSEASIKSTFVESVRDFTLRRELRKLAKANATMTFAQFRSLALKEFPEECISAESSSSKEVSGSKPSNLRTSEQKVITPQEIMLQQIEMQKEANRVMMEMQQQQTKMMMELTKMSQRCQSLQDSPVQHLSAPQPSQERRGSAEGRGGRGAQAQRDPRRRGPCYKCGTRQPIDASQQNGELQQIKTTQNFSTSRPRPMMGN